MTLETLLGELTHNEKLAAMDLLWRDLSADPGEYESPAWHGRVLADRLASPDPGGSLSLREAKAEIKSRLHARRPKT